MREKQIEELAQVIAYSCIDLVESSCGEGECCVSCLATKLHKEGVTIQKWIPVTERLPEYETEVLTYRKSGISVETRWRTYWDYDEFSDSPVTHWMPLPEPPKGE